MGIFLDICSFDILEGLFFTIFHLFAWILKVKPNQWNFRFELHLTYIENSI